jgi:LPS O-antigen subunit length determinant protein (WzzB/FepE family)
MKEQDDDLLVYDEDDAVKFILNFIPADSKTKINDEKIEYVLDVVYEFYDENGLIDEDSTEEASIDEEEMFKFILKCSKKDKMQLTEDEIRLILDGEYEYGKSLGIYTSED